MRKDVSGMQGNSSGRVQGNGAGSIHGNSLGRMHAMEPVKATGEAERAPKLAALQQRIALGCYTIHPEAVALTLMNLMLRGGPMQSSELR